MADVPAEKIAALAVEKLTQALPSIISTSVAERESAEANVRVALALVSLLAEPRKPMMRDVASPFTGISGGTIRQPSNAAGLRYPDAVISVIPAADEAI